MTTLRPPRLLLVGDFVAHTGFARVCELLAAELTALGWDLAVLAVNWHGDYAPQAQRYRMYPAALGGDLLGYGRIASIIRRERPDVVLIVNDPWCVSNYLEQLAADMVESETPPIVAYMPVDGYRINPRAVANLPRLSAWIAYTDHGAAELLAAAPALEHVPGSVEPHGIDLSLFRPIDRAEARQLAGVPEDLRNSFIVLAVNRNQIRKRLDTTVRAFAQFVQMHPEADARLCYHGAFEDVGWDIPDLMERAGVGDRLIRTARISATSGIPIEKMRVVYGMADVYLSTTMGEGWGLPVMEAMACGVPCLIPDSSALAEWAGPAAVRMPVDSEPWTSDGGLINTELYPVRADTVASRLSDAYRDPDARRVMAGRGLALVRQERFRWPVIAQGFDLVLREAVARRRMADAEEVTG